MSEGDVQSVLVVEDESDFRELILFKLKEAGFAPEGAANARDALKAAKRLVPAVVVLDIMLPDMPGTEVCKLLRADPTFHGTSILMLTAKGDEIDRVVGFELGADDYVVKPCSVRELILRVRALSRRAIERRSSGDARGAAPIRFGELEVDPVAHRVTVSSKEVALTPIEFKLLLLLLSNPGRAFSRDRLLDEVWNVTAEVTTRTVDTHVKRLRDKLGMSGEVIETIRGIGYRVRA